VERSASRLRAREGDGLARGDRGVAVGVGGVSEVSVLAATLLGRALRERLAKEFNSVSARSLIDERLGGDFDVIRTVFIALADLCGIRRGSIRLVGNVDTFLHGGDEKATSVFAVSSAASKGLAGSKASLELDAQSVLAVASVLDGAIAGHREGLELTSDGSRKVAGEDGYAIGVSPSSRGSLDSGNSGDKSDKRRKHIE